MLHYNCPSFQKGFQYSTELQLIFINISSMFKYNKYCIRILPKQLNNLLIANKVAYM